jgi:hypothetical protein
MAWSKMWMKSLSFHGILDGIWMVPKWFWRTDRLALTQRSLTLCYAVRQHARAMVYDSHWHAHGVLELAAGPFGPAALYRSLYPRSYAPISRRRPGRLRPPDLVRSFCLRNVIGMEVVLDAVKQAAFSEVAAFPAAAAADAGARLACYR